MILRISNKLAGKIKEKPEKIYPIHANPFVDWSLHLFYVDRISYILITNTLTKFSFIIYGKGIKDSCSLTENVITQMRDFMFENNFAEIFEKKIGPETKEIIFSKNLDRSVVGCMNELIFAAKCDLGIKRLSPGIASTRLNQMIVKQNIPLQVFIKLAEAGR